MATDTLLNAREATAAPPASDQPPKSHFRPAAPERPDGPQSLFRLFFGDMSRNGVVGWPWQSFELPHTTRRILGIRFHVISEPEAVKRILLDNVANYQKPPIAEKLLKPLAGDSLLVAKDENWKSQRRLMAPVFTPAAVAEFMPIFADVAEETARRWRGQAPGTIDVAKDATRSTFEVISQALYSGEPSLSSEEAAGHIAAVLAATGEYRVGSLLGLPWLDRSELTRKGSVGRKFILDRLVKFIAARQANPNPPQDFMTRIIEAFSAQHRPEVAAKLALDNAVTFFVAGHETTANAVTWALYLLANDQPVQDRARAECQAALSAGGDLESLPARLPYLRMVLDEAIRLYPPAPRIDRSALADDRLGDLQIRKGDWLTIWPWVLHRHKALWKDPDLFNPENFSPEAKASHHRFQYIPFGAGPRVCIGAQFSVNEALLLLSRWLAEFRFSPAPGHVVEPSSDLTLRPKGGLPLRVEAVG